VVCVLLLLLVAGCGGSAPTPQTPAEGAQKAEAAPAARKGTMVDIPNTKTQGYLALPDDKGRSRPAIILVHEWWGLDDWIKDNADRLAALGYIAFAPDLYHGKVATDREVAHELSRGLPNDRAMHDLDATSDFLAARNDIDATKIAVIGWCMGGGLALDYAVVEPRLAAVVVNYGHLIEDPAKIQKIQSPLLGNFAGQDKGIPPTDVREFEKKLRDAGKQVDFKMYDDAGHAFMNPKSKVYSEQATKDAWTRIDAFLARKLRSGG
jgi:carboxymethylenebutenolidase